MCVFVYVCRGYAGCMAACCRVAHMKWSLFAGHFARYGGTLSLRVQGPK